MSASTRTLRIALSLAGYATFALIVIWGIGAGKFVNPVGGDIPTIFQPAGDAFRSGQPVYAWKDLPFFYSPPLVIILGVISWLPTPVLFTGIVLGNVVALRYLARGWLRVGYLLWCVVLPFEFAAGQINIIMAAVLVGAVRESRTALPALLTLAKISPVLAVNPAKWRSFLVWTLLLVALTLPWFWLWPQWFDQLLRGWQTPVGPQIPIPFLIRLPLGLLLVATRTRLGRVTGAVIATPAFYWGSLVLLLAPVSIGFDLWDERRERRARPSTPEVHLAGSNLPESAARD
jgi:hypothetical protein